MGQVTVASTPWYVFLLVPSEHPNSAYRIVIARSAGRGGVDAQVIAASDSAGEGDFFIRVVSLSAVFNARFLTGLEVKDGIMLTDRAQNENGAEVYFWKDGKFTFEPVDQ